MAVQVQDSRQYQQSPSMIKHRKTFNRAFILHFSWSFIIVHRANRIRFYEQLSRHRFLGCILCTRHHSPTPSTSPSSGLRISEEDTPLSTCDHTKPNTMSESTQAGAALRLTRQLKEMQKTKDLPGISVGLKDENLFEWEVMLMINDECPYYGGLSSPQLPNLQPQANLPAGGNFNCLLTFPPTYPDLPPSLIFAKPIPFHPNIYPDGRLCISILHPPGDDQYGYESAAERWNPTQTPETILISVLSLLNSPNDESPANVEAARLWREERTMGNKEFRRRCRKGVRESLGEE